MFTAAHGNFCFVLVVFSDDSNFSSHWLCGSFWGLSVSPRPQSPACRLSATKVVLSEEHGLLKSEALKSYSHVPSTAFLWRRVVSSVRWHLRDAPESRTQVFPLLLHTLLLPLACPWQNHLLSYLWFFLSTFHLAVGYGVWLNPSSSYFTENSITQISKIQSLSPTS